MDDIKVGDTVELYTCEIKEYQDIPTKITATVYSVKGKWIKSKNKDYDYLDFWRKPSSREDFENFEHTMFCCKSNPYEVELL